MCIYVYYTYTYLQMHSVCIYALTYLHISHTHTNTYEKGYIIWMKLVINWHTWTWDTQFYKIWFQISNIALLNDRSCFLGVYYIPPKGNKYKRIRLQKIVSKVCLLELISTKSKHYAHYTCTSPWIMCINTWEWLENQVCKP